jgi:hypothetical protein
MLYHEDTREAFMSTGPNPFAFFSHQCLNPEPIRRFGSGATPNPGLNRGSIILHEGPVEFEQLVNIEYFLRAHNLLL